MDLRYAAKLLIDIVLRALPIWAGIFFFIFSLMRMWVQAGLFLGMFIGWLVSRLKIMPGPPVG